MAMRPTTLFVVYVKSIMSTSFKYFLVTTTTFCFFSNLLQISQM